MNVPEGFRVIDPSTCAHQWDGSEPFARCSRCGNLDIPEWAVGVTMKQMCEFVADIVAERDGVTVDPEAFFNASPSGELEHVFCAYLGAVAWRQAHPV